MKLRWTIVSAVTILTLTGAVVASVILYWIRIQGNPIRCIYAEPGCSLAVSTYALAGATALLVGGSLVAALLTIQQFEHDRSAFLSVQRCRRETACKFTETVAYLAHDVDVFRFEKPDGWDPMDWGVTYVDCASVGKGPLVAAELQIEIRPATDG
ncbi:MAG TPA: hypothetical protein VGX96_02250, partial [Candidatus Elarobacter sp.]|nr:hypothetical protein [Candidatus Elarobacter sp.]